MSIDPRKQPKHATVSSNIAWGLRGAAPIVAVYCVWVSLVHGVFGDVPFDRVGASLGAVIACYIGVGIASGALVGLLRPTLQTQLGCHVAGLVVGSAIGVGVSLTQRGVPGHWDTTAWLFPAILAVVGAVWGGGEFWKRFGRPE